MKENVILFFLLIFFVGKNSAQTLDNGVQLSDNWPPKNEIPEKRREMPVPYLEDKPDVIPVNRGRQLFVDDFLIKESNLKRITHKPDFYDSNPVLEANKVWEKTSLGAPYAAPFSDGVWYDEVNDKFKMWYLTGAGYLYPEKQSFYTGYAESDDGKNWTKNNQDVLDNTNIVDTTKRDSNTIWLDKTERDSTKRYKSFLVTNNSSKWHYTLKYSGDGIHWSDPVAHSGEIGDRSTAFYNPFIEKWVLSIRSGTPVSSRSRSYAEGENPEDLVSSADKKRVFWFTPDDKEPRNPDFPEIDPGIYNFDAMPYESIIIGYYSVWQGPENNVADSLGIQKRNEVLLGYSRDGFHYVRPSHEPFIGVDTTDRSWNNGNVQSTIGSPLIVHDSLYFYVSGRQTNNIMWDSHTSTGLATLRRDGFVSMHTKHNKGFLTTGLLSFTGKYMFINADIKENLEIELLDENGKPISGFSREDFDKLTNFDSTKKLVSWNGKKDLTKLNSQNIHIKFYLHDGDLYSFWISPWLSGESRGFTGGGGPGLDPSGVDKK